MSVMLGLAAASLSLASFIISQVRPSSSRPACVWLELYLLQYGAVASLVLYVYRLRRCLRSYRLTRTTTLCAELIPVHEDPTLTFDQSPYCFSISTLIAHRSCVQF